MIRRTLLSFAFVLIATGHAAAQADRAIPDAISELRPGATFSLRGTAYEGIEWLDKAQTKPTRTELAAKITEIANRMKPVLGPVLLGRLTDAEYVALSNRLASDLAGGNPKLARWLDAARADRTGIDLNSTATSAIKSALVSAGVLTAARADAVFAP